MRLTGPETFSVFQIDCLTDQLITPPDSLLTALEYLTELHPHNGRLKLHLETFEVRKYLLNTMTWPH